MKEVIDLNGAIRLVPLETPVKTLSNGRHYLLNEIEMAGYDARNGLHESLAPERALKVIYANRKQEYGAIEDQLDMIFHKGLDSWKEHIQSIKNKHPKS